MRASSTGRCSRTPGRLPVTDLSLESHAVDLINATPAGEQITFALRDFNRQRVADALIAAHNRGVRVDGVIDGGERNRPVVASCCRRASARSGS